MAIHEAKKGHRHWRSSPHFFPLPLKLVQLGQPGLDPQLGGLSGVPVHKLARLGELGEKHLVGLPEVQLLCPVPQPGYTS